MYHILRAISLHSHFGFVSSIESGEYLQSSMVGGQLSSNYIEKFLEVWTVLRDEGEGVSGRGRVV